MSNRAIDAALGSSVEDPTCRHVLLVLANRASDDDGLCWPALDSLVMDTGLHRSTIQRALASLVEQGHLSYADGARSTGGRNSTRYKFHPLACSKRAEKKERRRLQRGEKLLPGFVIEGSHCATPAVALCDPRGSTALPLPSHCATPAVALCDPSGSTALPHPSHSATRTQSNPKGNQSEPTGAAPSPAAPLDLATSRPEAGTEEKKEGPPGTPAGHLAERIVRAYPANGRFYDAVRAVLAVLNAGRDGTELLASVQRFAERWRALPERERAYCPGLHTFFEQAGYDGNPDAHPWICAKGEASGTGSGASKKMKAPPGEVETARLNAARKLWPDMPAGARWLDLAPEQRDLVLDSMNRGEAA